MTIYFIVNVAVIFTAFVGNLLVILVVTFNRIFHKMKHFLLASLALSDFIFVTFIQISRLVSVAYKEWIFGEQMCQGTAFLVRILYVNTFFHLCAVSYERYLAIVKDHLTYDGRITARKIVLSTIVLWILPTIIFFISWLGSFRVQTNTLCMRTAFRQRDNVPVSTHVHRTTSVYLPVELQSVSNCKTA